jgi:hypothetical protein
MMPKARYKESHKPVNRARLYEIEEISSNSSALPRAIIPPEYWKRFEQVCAFYESVPAALSEEAPF